MVLCAMDNISPAPPSPPPPPPPLLARNRSSQRSAISPKGFRLLNDDQTETGSICSIYKQKIDQMFESDSSSNSIQARIERMFTEIANDAGFKSDMGYHTFSVDYLGSVPLGQKVTSLTGLQTPLKELYFAYRRNMKHKTLTGRLEISHLGLKVQYQGDKGDLEQLNPFPTIAVWSAVKFVLHTQPTTSFAFLPLITDPDNIDKQSLFQKLDASDSKHFLNQNHAPLFAVVMRKIGLHKQLECHGFVCQTSEDAIVIAATLYKSLMSHMRNKKPKNRNGISCMSISSSVCAAESVQTSATPPVRPPRIKKRGSNASSSITSETEQPIAASMKKSTKSKKAPTVPPNNVADEIRPYEEPKIITETKTVSEDDSKQQQQQRTSGDILTKVTIPRSGSFLNAGGLTRYKSKVCRMNGQATGGSPLGFSELFNEFRLQEGLHSMDEILGVIIDPEGMSFNDLKPIYKEFLLKLAVTLTKDELYQRSKSIMRRQKKKILGRSSTAQNHRIVGAKGLKRVFRKSFRMNMTKKLVKRPLKGSVIPKQQQPQESSISTSSYDTRHFRPKQTNLVQRKQSARKRSSDRKQTNLIRTRRERMSTSEDSDFFTMKRSKSKSKPSPNNQNNRNSSSGYVSCSECSYDSDTCTCMSADKCYCSLGNKFDRDRRTQIIKTQKCRASNSFLCGRSDKCYCNYYDKNSFKWCGCDTDSCTDSNKCYCLQSKTKETIFEQLKRRGFIPASRDVITPPNERKLCKKLSNTKITKSVEYLQNPTEKYYGQMLKKRGANWGNEILRGCGGGGKFHGKAMSEVTPRNFSFQSSVRSFKSFTGGGCGNNVKSHGKRIPADSSMEALSVKKSAEIAALFADIKLSQTTDITHLPANNTTTTPNPPLQQTTKSDRKAIVTPYKHVTPAKSVQNGRTPAAVSNMYSARNGLYTIQSQSDSSCSENRNDKPYQNYGLLNKNNSTSFENTLGYLP